MEIKSFKDLYIADLQELADVERQLTESLPRVANAASHAALKNALLEHRQETESQKERLELLLQKHGASPKEHRDQAMQAMINETEKMLAMLKGKDLRDAGLIASTQRLKHYEIAAYGTAAALAGQLDFHDDQTILREILDEEKRADASLTRLAESEVNRDALAA
jgi:ferritin-like metal-binding protein YciE